MKRLGLTAVFMVLNLARCPEPSTVAACSCIESKHLRWDRNSVGSCFYLRHKGHFSVALHYSLKHAIPYFIYLELMIWDDLLCNYIWGIAKSSSFVVPGTSSVSTSYIPPPIGLKIDRAVGVVPNLIPFIPQSIDKISKGKPFCIIVRRPQTHAHPYSFLGVDV